MQAVGSSYPVKLSPRACRRRSNQCSACSSPASTSPATRCLNPHLSFMYPSLFSLLPYSFLYIPFFFLSLLTSTIPSFSSFLMLLLSSLCPPLLLFRFPFTPSSLSFFPSILFQVFLFTFPLLFCYPSPFLLPSLHSSLLFHSLLFSNLPNSLLSPVASSLLFPPPLSCHFPLVFSLQSLSLLSFPLFPIHPFPSSFLFPLPPLLPLSFTIAPCVSFILFSPSSRGWFKS